MSHYHLALLSILVLAGAVNLYQPRALTLVFLSAVFLLFVDKLIPSPDILQAAWFEVLIKWEFVFAIIALLSVTTSGYVVAGFCVWNMIGHGLGLIAFDYDLPGYAYYSPFIRAGELGQALALFLFSQPIIHAAVWYRSAKRSAHDGWHRLEHHPS